MIEPGPRTSREPGLFRLLLLWAACGLTLWAIIGVLAWLLYLSVRGWF